MINLKHSFVKNCPKILLEDLFNNVDSLNKFIKNIEKVCKNQKYIIEQYFTIYDSINSDALSTFRGDVFEVFVEFLLQAFQYSPHIGIVDYSPWDIEKEGSSDYGIDGTGTFNSSTLPETFVAVQCKYRSNANYMLTANKDHISNFVAKTMTLDKVKNRSSKMYIFTSCKGLNLDTNEKMYENMIKVFGIKEINKVLGNKNKAFWKSFEESLRVKLVN